MNIIIQGLKSTKLITQGYAAAPEIHVYSSSGVVTRTIAGASGVTTKTIASSTGELD